MSEQGKQYVDGLYEAIIYAPAVVCDSLDELMKTKPTLVRGDENVCFGYVRGDLRTFAWNFARKMWVEILKANVKSGYSERSELLEKIDELEAERDRYRKALEYYAERKHLLVDPDYVREISINWNIENGMIGPPYIKGAEMGQHARVALKGGD